jgi:hypothetical protein
LCKNNYYYALLIESAPTPTSTFPHQHTGIVDSGSSSFYCYRSTPVANYNPRSPTVSVTVANGFPKHFVTNTTLASIPTLPPSMTTMSGHVMPSFPHTLISLGPFPNQGCKIVFDKTSVTVYHPNGLPILNRLARHRWPPTLAVPPHHASSSSSTLATFGSNSWWTISSHVSNPAAPQPRLPG